MTKIALCAGLSALALFAAPATAQAPAQSVFASIEPGKAKRVEVQLKADARLLGIPFELARGTMRATLEQESYRVEADYRSSGFANDRKEAGRVTVSGRVAEGVLRPQSYLSQESSGKKRRIGIDFAAPRVEVDVAPRWGSMGNPPASDAEKRQSVDPLTGLLELSLVTGRDRGQACGGMVRIFDGKRRYDIRTSYDGQTRVSVPGYSGPAIRCRGAYVAVAGFDEPGARHNVTIWLADVGGAGLSVPVRMTGGNAVVSAVLTAQRVTVSDS
jgi:hypothetical protein